ncbi:hypothetical protein ASPWEDRAFT_103172 [Aspergillus wentii DTO 134E9]|uniref:Probable endonuclease LCL3 n=1 Tax=Aspergillus wentii DTO 134E9 TaxID=1073089 RepID=A0A1L9RY28_ASPWE|nr:uncharacterized protein ASPWEDRAFT_103172 [Aspergillus wentii DTO 134E9]KAI9931582.1 putative endonuclease lcl3 [Aspergillus wentii]OJJ39747.1 hypothetical protein ASPWEDRAFT_103172 [Aspergillus wentii DTO 134E9]
MRWPPWASESPRTASSDEHSTSSIFSSSSSSSSAPASSSSRNWNDALNGIDWAAFTEPSTIFPTCILTGGILGAVYIHRRFLRRIPDATSISPSHFRNRSLYGQVTSVGDGDGFRLYHTPGGRLGGWGWLPWKKVPTTRKELKDKTVSIRLAGVDAPERAHFGRPEQPFAREAHTWLTSYLLNRSVRAYIHRPDQYQRAVASVYVRRAFDFPIPFRRRDVSYEMLKRGLATVYEAKSGSEFGGEKKERKYRKIEDWAKRKGKGLWKDYRRKGDQWESPRAYKTRMGMGEPTDADKK